MKMRRWILILTCLALLLALPACQKPEEGPDDEDQEASPSWQEQYDLGVRYMGEGNYQEAVLAFTAAIEIDPNNAKAYANRGNAYHALAEDAYSAQSEADYEKYVELARADYEKYLELDGSSAGVWINLAILLYNDGDYFRSVEILQEGLGKAEDPSSIEEELDDFAADLIPYWLELFQDYCDDGQYDEARSFIQQCIDTGIDDGSLQAALDDLDASQAAAADDAMVAEAYEKLENGQYDEAISTLQEERGSFSDPDKCDAAITDLQQLSAWAQDGRPLFLVGTWEDLDLALSQHPKDSIIVVKPGAVLKIPYDPMGDDMGRGYVFDSLENVVVWGDGTPQLLVGSLYVPAITMTNCTNVILHGLIVGHDPAVRGEVGFECPEGSDVIVIDGWGAVSQVTIENCDLFGCGFCGITASSSTDVTVRDTVIHDCSMKIADIRGKGLFENCTFRNNAYSYEDVLKTQDIMYVDMMAPCILPTGNQPVIFNSCVFENNQHPKFTQPDADVQFNDCTFTGNAWEQN